MQGNGSFNLKDMAKRTPAVPPVEALRRSMVNALAGAVTEKDMADIVAKLKEQSLAGDKKAMEIFFKLMLGDGKIPEPPAEPKGLNKLAEAIEDLVDEVRIAKAGAPKNRRSVLTGPDDEDDED